MAARTLFHSGYIGPKRLSLKVHELTGRPNKGGALRRAQLERDRAAVADGALIEKEHPELSEAELRYNAVHVCGAGGYHGPFANRAVYDAFGEGWQGTGDCRMCWNTRHVPTELAAEREAAQKGAA